MKNVKCNQLTFEAIESLRKQLEITKDFAERNSILSRLINLYVSIDFQELSKLMSKIQDNDSEYKEAA